MNSPFTVSPKIARTYLSLRNEYWNFVDNVCPGSPLKFEDYCLTEYEGEDKEDAVAIVQNLQQVEAEIPRAGIIVYCRKRKAFLMAQQITSKRWAFPGGKVEGDDIFEEAKRETLEEVGIKIDKFMIVKTFKQYAYTWYVAIGDFTWYDPEESGAVKRAKEGRELLNVEWRKINEEKKFDNCRATWIAYLEMKRMKLLK